MAKTKPNPLPEVRRSRERLLQDPIARQLLEDLVVGPADPELFRLVIGAGQLITLGLSLLEAISQGANQPASRNMDVRRAVEAFRRGDRLRKGGDEVWTDLADGAVYDAGHLLDAWYLDDLKADLYALTPRGLRATGKDGILWLLTELSAETRAKLADSAAQAPRIPATRVQLDADLLKRHARALRKFANLLDDQAAASGEGNGG